MSLHAGFVLRFCVLVVQKILEKVQNTPHISLFLADYLSRRTLYLLNSIFPSPGLNVREILNAKILRSPAGI